MQRFPLMAERPVDGDWLTPFTTLYERGVRLMQVDATCSEDIFHPQLRAWVEPDQFDYRVQEAYWTRLLEACPDAKLCLRLYVASPPWWDAAHSEELQQYADGRTTNTFQRTDRQTLPSLASIAWRGDAQRSVRAFLKWLETSRWADRVWGFLVSYGITWEWGILGSDDFLDYSKPMLTRFRQWLKETYTDVAKLRTAWANASVDFETATIPGARQRMRSDNGLRVFPRDRAAFDFQNCLSDVNAEYLLALAGTMREVSGTRYQLGAFYGYTLTAREHSAFMGRYGAGGFQGGHHAYGKVLRSGLLDFIGSPYAYGNRDLGTGLLIQHFPLASTRHHGLHAYDESDLWTFTNPPGVEAKISVGHTRTREDSIRHQRLVLAQALCKGTSYWWTELTQWIGSYSPNYSDPELLAEMGRHVKWFGKLRDERSPVRSAAQMAIVIDERSIAALGLESRLFRDEVYKALPTWAWTGRPFDVWLASDATKDTMSPYRLVYVFAPFLDHALRQSLRTALCHSDRTVWWAPQTGTLTDTGRYVAAFADLTGFDDPDALLPLPAKRKRDGWTSLYGPIAAVTSEQLAEIASAAGVHAFAPAPSQVMASDRFLAIHARHSGQMKLSLDHSSGWRELFTGQPLRDGLWTFGERDVALFVREEL